MTPLDQLSQRSIRLDIPVRVDLEVIGCRWQSWQRREVPSLQVLQQGGHLVSRGATIDALIQGIRYWGIAAAQTRRLADRHGPAQTGMLTRLLKTHPQGLGTGEMT